MSITGWLDQSLGLGAYRLTGSACLGGRSVLELEADFEKLRCPVCGRANLVGRGTVRRRIRTVPIGSRPTELHLRVQRVYCRHCRSLRQVELPFARPHARHSRSFERYVVDLTQYMTIQDVAHHLQVGWDLVKDILKDHLRKQPPAVRLKDLRQIAVDEIHVGQRGYLTLVLDLASGAVVYVGQGRDAAALDGFFRRLKRNGQQIQAVAMDMSAAYQAAVRNHLPQAAIVFDHFHLIKLMNEKLSDFRRELQREAEGPLQKQVLKGTRWLLLKNPQNLNDTKQEKQRLQEALDLNQPLATVYYMKEDLRQLWSQGSKQQAEAFLNDWIGRASSAGIPMLQRFAKFLASHRSGILAWYDHPITTGPLEGTNNKIRTLQRQAYGYRDQEFFVLRIYAIHRTKYALVG